MIELLVDTRVNLPKGSVVEVSDNEAKRLISLGFAIEKSAKKTTPKKKDKE